MLNGERTFDSRIDSLSLSLIVSTSCSSTKSSRDLGSSASGRNEASTIVDRKLSIVDSSLSFAASSVFTTRYSKISRLPKTLSATIAYLKVMLPIFIYILDATSDFPQYLDLSGDPRS
jgi:hypothetical protein